MASNRPGDSTMTNKQKAFVDAYQSNGFNATQAAIAAGYSSRSAREIGRENLTKPDIQAEIRKRLTTAGITSNQVLQEMAKALGLYDNPGLDEAPETPCPQ